MTSKTIGMLCFFYEKKNIDRHAQICLGLLYLIFFFFTFWLADCKTNAIVLGLHTYARKHKRMHARANTYTRANKYSRGAGECQNKAKNAQYI